MPAKSKSQQAFFGMVHKMQQGGKVKGASKKLKDTAKKMKPGDVKDFASTKTKRLPEKKRKKAKPRHQGDTFRMYE